MPNGKTILRLKKLGLIFRKKIRCWIKYGKKYELISLVDGLWKALTTNGCTSHSLKHIITHLKFQSNSVPLTKVNYIFILLFWRRLEDFLNFSPNLVASCSHDVKQNVTLVDVQLYTNTEEVINR